MEGTSIDPTAEERLASEISTRKHIARVNQLISEFCTEMLARGVCHDASKLEEPERSGFARLEKLSLRKMQYGSDEYKAALAKEKPAINHHYANNSHHPEHYVRGVNDFDLYDLVEMLLDWKAATERMQGGGNIAKSIEYNKTRFSIDPQLISVLSNHAARHLSEPFL